MIVLGLILIVLAVAAGAVLFIATQPLTDPVSLEALGVQAKVLPLVLLIAGAAVLLLFWLGLVMVRGSVRRKARRRRESKELALQAEREAEARRAAEARAEEARLADNRTGYRDDRAAETLPPARYADTRERPGDGWADDAPTGRHAAPTTTATRVDDSDTRTTAQDSPSMADRLMGRDKNRDSGRA